LDRALRGGARRTEDPASFDLVTFEGYQDEGGYMDEGERRVRDPSWQTLDRVAVETLIGGALDER